MPLKGRLPFNIKLAYGLGQGAEGLMNGAFGTFLLFYYNQVLGMSAGLAATAVGTAVIIDAMTDPLAGSISDYWKSPLGRRHPFMYVSALPLAVSFFLLFNPPRVGEIGLFIWLVAFTNLTRTAMTFYHVPHIALGAEITEDFSERSAVVGFRMFFGTMGWLVVFWMGFGLFFSPTPEFRNGQLNAHAYPPFALTLAALMALTIWWSAFGTRSVIPHLPPTPVSARVNLKGVFVRTFTDMVDALRCGSFRWLFLGVLLLFVVVGVDGALNLYIYTYFWELSRADIAIYALGYPAGLLVGTMIAPMLQRRYGKRPWLMFGTFSWAFWQTIPIVLRFSGLLPANDSEWLLPALFAMRVIQGGSTVQSLVAFNAMIADTIDEYELSTGKRTDGIFYAASSFSGKAAVGIGNVIAGFGLDIISWPRGPHVRSAADVPHETLFHLGFMYGPLIGGLALVSVWCYTHYKMTREEHDRILDALSIQRERIAH